MAAKYTEDTHEESGEEDISPKDFRMAKVAQFWKDVEGLANPHHVNLIKAHFSSVLYLYNAVRCRLCWKEGKEVTAGIQGPSDVSPARQLGYHQLSHLAEFHKESMRVHLDKEDDLSMVVSNMYIYYSSSLVKIMNYLSILYMGHAIYSLSKSTKLAILWFQLARMDLNSVPADAKQAGCEDKHHPLSPVGPGTDVEGGLSEETGYRKSHVYRRKRRQRRTSPYLSTSDSDVEQEDDKEEYFYPYPHFPPYPTPEDATFLVPELDYEALTPIATRPDTEGASSSEED